MSSTDNFSAYPRRSYNRTPDKTVLQIMDPTGRFPDKPRTALGLVELDVSAEGVGLEDPGVVGQMRLRMLTTSIARVIKHRRRRI
jgi:hypothetical protein